VSSLTDYLHGQWSNEMRAIMNRLRRGPAFNWELAGMSTNHRARVDDLREAGHRIRCEIQPSGVTKYTLEEDDDSGTATPTD